MEIKLKYIFILFTIGLVLYGLNKFKDLNKYVALYEDLHASNENLQNTFNKIKKDKNSLTSIIKDLESSNQELAKQLVSLRKQKNKIKYIDIVKYQTKEVIVSYSEVPNLHIFSTEQGLPLCSFEYKDTYEFKILPVDYSLNVIHTNKQSVYKMTAYSTYDEQTYEIPINLNESKVIEVEEYPKIELNVNAGISINYGDRLNISPTIGFPIVHLNKSLDIISPEITFIENSIVPGISFADYKVSDNLTLLEDTWVGLNYSRTLNSNYIGLTIKSKF